MGISGVQHAAGGWRSLIWRSIPKVAAMLVLIIGVAALLGWVLALPYLKSLIPGAVEMKANTAIGFILSACALFLLSGGYSMRRQQIAQSLALIVMLLGLATLSEYLSGMQLGIDEWLFLDSAHAYNKIPGRMSPFSAAAFTLVGLALAALPSPGSQKLVRLASLFVLLTGALSLLGYAWNASELVTDQWLPPVAVHTAIAFIFLGLAILRVSYSVERHLQPDSLIASYVLAGFVVAVLLLILAGGYTYRTVAKYEVSAYLVQHSQEVRGKLSHLYGMISDVQSAQRNYLLTGQPLYKQLYVQRVAALNLENKELLAHLDDNPERWLALVLLIEHRLELLERHLSIFEHQGLSAVSAAISSDDGIKTMYQIHELIEQMNNQEMKLLSSNELLLKQQREHALLVLLVTLLVGVATLSLLFAVIRRQIKTREETENKLQNTAARIVAIVDTVADGIITISQSGTIETVNPATARLFGYADVEMIGQNVKILMPEPYQSQHDGYLAHYHSTGDARVIGIGREVVGRRQDGSTFPMELAVSKMQLGDGYHYTGIVRDITTRKMAEAQQLASIKELADFKAALDEHAIVVTTDVRGMISYVNDKFCAISKYARNELIGQNHRIINSGFHPKTFFTELWKTISSGNIWKGEIKNRAKDGSFYWVDTTIVPFLDARGKPVQYIAIRADISERKRAEQMLLVAKDQAELANHAKDAFLATMSHEIRTPLTGMLGMLEVLSLGSLDTDQTQTLKMVWDSSRSLLRIVNDILDWSKIEEGKLELSECSTSIPLLLEEVVNTYSRVASSKSLMLWQRADSRLSSAHLVDPLRLSQILNNFVSNALKFTTYGEIEVRAELLGQMDSGERIRFSVKDTGVGIAPEVQAQLFQRYHQESADTARMYGGTGLGLAICRRLAELMDGQVELHSVPGQGSTFSITLILPVSDAPCEKMQAITQVAQQKVQPIQVYGNDVPLVLAVDDHPVNRDLLARQIKLLGLQSETAENGKVALSLWRQGRFALVITDCHMPEMDGYGLVRAIRHIEAEQLLTSTPVIAWTANALAEEERLCHAAGMDDLLVKPADLTQLKKMLEKWLPLAQAGNPQNKHA